MLSNLLLVIVPSILTAFTTWFLSRRKYQAEVKANELDNLEKAVKIWRELSEDLEKRLKTDIHQLREENLSIQERFTTVLAENEALKDQMSALEQQLIEARQENRKLLEELKRFNNNYNTFS